MSVQTQINRLSDAKSAIKTAIENKGITVPSATKLDGMAALIETIPSGGGDLTLLTSGSKKPTGMSMSVSGVSKSPKLVQLYFNGTTSKVANIKPCMVTIVLDSSLSTIGLYAQTVVASISDTITVTTDTNAFSVEYSGTTAIIICNTSGWFSSSYTWNYVIWG